MTRTVVLASKLQPPIPRPDAVARPDVVAHLEECPAGGLRVIVAPTGWGKSQLVAEWLSVHETPVAYLALDRSDNDPTRCWTHLLAAIADATDIDVAELVAALRAPALPLLPEIVEPLVAQLGTTSLTIVIEDYHLISSPEVHESVEALIDLAPPDVALAIVTRTEPPLHLPRRRVAAQLCEVRLDQLRMGPAAATRILTSAIGTPLDDELVRVLVERTEGWAAGLYLAGLSLRTADDPKATVESFAGDDRLISDYLSSEVLSGLDDDDRQFLLGTALLTELEPTICDELLEATDSAVRLDHLSRTNLFLIPTDTTGRTYRYHHLFSDWLRLEAERTDPDGLRRSHRRAAEIYASRNEHALAVDHALEAADTDLAYRLVGQSGVDLIDTGQHSTVARWCAQLPATDSTDQMVDLAALRAWLAIVDGDVDAAEYQCRIAQDLLGSKSWTSGIGLGDAGEIDVLRSYAHLLGGSFHAAGAAAEAARKGGTSARTLAALAFVESATRYWIGEPDPDLFVTTRALSLEISDPYAVLLADAYLALIALDDHDPHAAEPLIAASFATARAAGLHSFGYAAICHLARARHGLLTGDVKAALDDAQRAVELAPRRNDLPVGCLAGMVLAEARHSLGDPDAADSLRTVAADIASIPDPGILESRLSVIERQLRLPAGQRRSPRLDAPVEALTDREMGLLRLLPGTLSQRELGEALHVSFNTVKTYNRQIYRKLGVSSRDDAVAAAKTFGLL